MSASIGQSYSYEAPTGRCSVVVIKGGRILETRRDGKTFIYSDAVSTEWYLSKKDQRKWASEAEWRASLPEGTVTTPPRAPTQEEVQERARALWRANPSIWHRRFNGRTLHEELGVGYREAYAALAAVECEPPAPAPASPESAFYERALQHLATNLVRMPSAKDEAWESRDRAVYDAADPTPRWGLPAGGLYLWLAVQHGDAFVPVCRNNAAKVLRFYIDGSLRTFAEAGIAADAPLWARVSEADPTLKRVT